MIEKDTTAEIVIEWQDRRFSFQSADEAQAAGFQLAKPAKARATISWPDPTPEMMETPEFNAVWECIKYWDINVPGAYCGYCGATGNHVRAILDSLVGMGSPRVCDAGSGAVKRAEYRMAGWKSIKSAPMDGTTVDLWLSIYASPRSFGWSDGFRVVDCWHKDGKWVHRDGGDEKELNAEYITHWMPIPPAPKVGGRVNG